MRLVVVRFRRFPGITWILDEVKTWYLDFNRLFRRKFERTPLKAHNDFSIIRYLLHLVVLLGGPISQISTQYMDSVEIFNIVLDLLFSL